MENQNISKVVKSIRNEAIYQRKDQIKQALKRISKSEVCPFEVEGNKLVIDNVRCECDARYFPALLRNENGKCRKCDRKII